MKINQKETRLNYAKSIDAEKGTITAYVSTYQWDRMDERFAKGAWDLTNYLKNPVVLWAHDYKQAPIAKAVDIQEDEQGLLTLMQFAPDQRSQEILGLYNGGYMSAFSVGFNPRDFKVEPIDVDRKGIVYTKADLLEYSAVPVPANPGAVVGREVAEIIQKHVGSNAIIKLKDNGDGNFVINPVEEPEEKDFMAQLKYLHDLAKAAKAQKLSGADLQLLTNAVDVFQEIIQDNTEGVPSTIVEELEQVVKSYAEVVTNLYPSAEETVRRVMIQIDKALAGKAA